MQDPYENIEAYLAGALSPEDKAVFETAMASDDQLKQAVEDFGFMDLIGEALVEEEIRGMVEEEFGGGHPEEHSEKKPINLWIKVVTVFLGILLLWCINKYMGTNVDHQEIEKRFAMSFEFYKSPNTDSYRGEGNIDPDLYSRAIRSFEHKHFETAKVQFDSLATTSTLPQDDINFYQAHIAFRQRDFSTSLRYIDRISASSKNIESARLLKLLISYVIEDKEHFEKLCSDYLALQPVCKELAY